MQNGKCKKRESVTIIRNVSLYILCISCYRNFIGIPSYSTCFFIPYIEKCETILSMIVPTVYLLLLLSAFEIFPYIILSHNASDTQSVIKNPPARIAQKDFLNIKKQSRAILFQSFTHISTCFSRCASPILITCCKL